MNNMLQCSLQIGFASLASLLAACGGGGGGVEMFVGNPAPVESTGSSAVAAQTSTNVSTLENTSNLAAINNPSPVVTVPAPSNTATGSTTGASILRSTVDLNDPQQVAKVAMASLSNVLPGVTGGGESLVPALFSSPSQSFPYPCYSGGSGSTVTTNADGKPSVGDKTEISQSNCAQGTPKVSYRKATGTWKTELTALSAYSTNGAWTATAIHSSPSLVEDYSYLASPGVVEEGTQKSAWNFVQNTSFDGKGTASTADDLFTVKEQRTYSISSTAANGQTISYSVVSSSTCTHGNASSGYNKLSCSSTEAQYEGDLTNAGLGYFQSVVRNVGTVTSTPSTIGGEDFILGRYAIDINGAIIYVDFYGTQANPMVKITSPNGSVQTMTYAQFIEG